MSTDDNTQRRPPASRSSAWARFLFMTLGCFAATADGIWRQAVRPLPTREA